MKMMIGGVLLGVALAAGLCNAQVGTTAPTNRPVTITAQFARYERLGPYTLTKALEVEKTIKNREPRAITFVRREKTGWFVHVYYP